MKNLHALGATALLAVAACASAPAAKESLAGTRWAGTAGPGAESRAAPRIEFVGEGRVSGFTGCNMFSGTWRMEGAEATLGAIAATKRMCIGPEAEVEKRFLAALAEGSRARREGTRLVVTAPTGARFELGAAQP